jgi:peptidoglycan/LPS O-acetylase OafA/YrhL
MMVSARRTRWLELDALRAFAVMLVVWSHSTNRAIGLTGFEGVLLFFVISGFLITHILLEARGAAPPTTILRAFYLRRFLRIFPIYYVVLFLTALAGVPNVRDGLAWHAAYLSNWYYALGGPLDKAVHLWSLAVEEQFYLLWPWCALLLSRAALRAALGLMIVTGPMSRLVLGCSGANSVAVWTTTPSVFDALGLGCFLAYVWKETELADLWANWACGLASGNFSALRLSRSQPQPCPGSSSSVRSIRSSTGSPTCLRDQLRVDAAARILWSVAADEPI